MTGHLQAMLRKLAGETCPNFRPRYEVSDDKWHSDLEVVVMRVLPRHYDRDPESLVPYYTNPRHVVRDKYGTVIAFLGLPDSHEFKVAVETRIEKYKNIRREDRNKKIERKQKMEALFYGEVVPERPATPPPLQRLRACYAGNYRRRLRRRRLLPGMRRTRRLNNVNAMYALQPEKVAGVRFFASRRIYLGRPQAGVT